MVKPLTWLIVMLLVAGYVAFFVGRYRREQAAKRPTAPLPASDPPTTRPLPTVMPTAPPVFPAMPSDGPPSSPAAPGEATAGAPPPFPPDAEGPIGPGDPAVAGDGSPWVGSAVVDLLQGIRLPDDLVPRPDVIERAGTHDRVVFITTETPADVLRDRLIAAFEVIGTEARWDPDGWQAFLVRDHHTGWVRIHPSPTGVVPPGTLLIPTVPSHTVCAEFWTDAAA
jgi:hypothetical protein